MTAPKNGRPKLYPDAEESSGVHEKVKLAPRLPVAKVHRPELFALRDAMLLALDVSAVRLFQSRDLVAERRELFWQCRQLDPQPSFQAIADAFGIDKESVVYGIRRKNGAPAKKGKGGEPTPQKVGIFCGACGNLTHRAERPSCARCGLEHESEPPLHATDFARISSSFGQLLKPENLPDLPGYWQGRTRK